MVPWAVITVCFGISAALLLVLRYMLAKENERRDAQGPNDPWDNAFVAVEQKDGTIIEKPVDRVRSRLMNSSRSCNS